MKDKLIDSWFGKDSSFDDYLAECKAAGYRYTGQFKDGKPVLERLQ